MLTKEQIKNLKRGDKVLAEASVEYVFADGDIHVKVKTRKLDNTIGESQAVLHSSCLSLPTPPKYDPTRRFKKGDVVCVVKYKGRDFNRFAKALSGKTLVVHQDEKEHCFIAVLDPMGTYLSIDPAYLKLITPVEEVEPYSVIDSPKTYNIVQAGKKGFFATFYKNQPLAKQEAESYCKRLNDEWRKEHENED